MSAQTCAAIPDKSDAVIQTILVPLDGSALAEAALPPARRLARITNATLVLVRVAQTRSFGVGALAAQDAAVTEAEAYLGRITHDVRYRDVAVHTDVFVNDPATGIAVAALAHGADVIVMSTHGRSGVSRVLLGSVAERVLRETALPVVLVRGVQRVKLSTLPPVGAYRTILVPLDGTALAEEAVRYIGQELWAHDAEILLLHSEQSIARPVVPSAIYSDELVESLARGEQEVGRPATAVRAYLQRVAQKYLSEHTLHLFVTMGDPAMAILHIAADHDVDLIVMTTHARAGIQRLLDGSVAAGVLAHGDVPVLLLRASHVTAAVGEPATPGDAVVAQP